MNGPGYLDVRLKNPSVFLSTNLPYVVRDARHAVVHRGTVGFREPTPLPAGLYSVALVTATGQQVVDLVQVSPGATTSWVVPHDDAGETGPEDVQLPANAVRVMAATGCTVVDDDGGGWTFVPAHDLDSVPTVVLDVAGRVVHVSLPLNPAATAPGLSACTVAVATTSAGPRLRVSFAEGRRVSRMVDGLLRNSAIASGLDVLDAATELLLHKYSDPPGAALGGLTLHRLGRLPERRAWVENLARDFAWLPDGRVLLAALLLRDPAEAERQRGLSMLLDATTKRPLYTDGLSLAMDLLRHWPDPPSHDLRRARLGALSEFSSHADWSSVPLIVDVEPA